MKILGRYILAASLFAVCGNAMAQTLNSAYFTEDYKYRHNMNPAYGNEQNYIAVPAIGNISVGLQGNFGIGDVLFDNPEYGRGSTKKKTTFLNPYISNSDALSGFSKGNNRLNANVDLTVLSAGFKGFGGYNTISIDARTNVGVSLPYELFEFARNTGNNTYNIGDIEAHAQSFVQLAFGHSRNINDKLRVGAKVKLLFGAARGDVKLKGMRADLAGEDKWTVSGKAVANVSMKGFSYKEETKDYNDESKGSYDRVNDVDVNSPGVGGFGLAFDFGGTYKINDDITVSAALLDLGFISWSNNLQAVNRQESFEFNGFHDVAVKDKPGSSTIDDQADSYGDQISDFANLTTDGDKGGRTTGIGMTFNAGCEYTFPLYRNLKFGFLSTTRINGKYSWTEGRLSANVAPLKFIDGGLSFAVNSFTASCGWVVNIHPKGFNVFVGMDHILGKTSKEYIPLSSNASVNLGFNVAF